MWCSWYEIERWGGGAARLGGGPRATRVGVRGHGEVVEKEALDHVVLQQTVGEAVRRVGDLLVVVAAAAERERPCGIVRVVAPAQHLVDVVHLPHPDKKACELSRIHRALAARISAHTNL